VEDLAELIVGRGDSVGGGAGSGDAA